MSELDEIVQEFLVESYENLDQLDRDLVLLEQDPASRDLLSSIFRTIHTIKGTSGFLALPRLEALTHVGENLLSKLRDGALALNPAITDGLLELVDEVRTLLGSIERTGGEGTPDHAALIAKLGRLQEVEEPLEEWDEIEGPLLGEILIEQTAVLADDVTVAAMEQQLGDERRIGEILVERGHATEDDIVLARASQLSAQNGVVDDQRSSVVDSTIRVDVAILDSLMRLVGELVLTRNQLVAQSGGIRTEASNATQRLSMLVSELQEGVMKTRMQPIDAIWNKLPRVVRDLAATCGRQARLELEGRSTELDRSILEAVKDPLMHLIRNAMDHGIEPPADRISAGKPAEGVIRLKAYHQGDQVNIEIGDDGAGVDPQRIAAKAVERGLITPAQAKALSDRELTSLIFLPGFSTAKVVTNVSGRGVGMDVVRANVEKIGGAVDVTSVLGVGTTFLMKIPLTLAIIPALTLACSGELFAVPQVSVVELLCLEGEEALRGVEDLAGAPVHRLRGSLLPLVRLDEALGLEPRPAMDATGAVTYIVVLQVDGQRFGLIVDDVFSTQEIVVKPVGRQVKGLGVYVGATILGDGAVALILDVRSFARRARAVRELEGVDSVAGLLANAVEHETEGQLLLVQVGEHRRVGIPLAEVSRLEEVPVAALEQVGDQCVVQYRDTVLPITWLAPYLGATPSRQEQLTVVVYDRNGRSVGLVVDAVIDVGSVDPDVHSEVVADGLLGSTVVDGKVTEMLDVRQAILAADPHFFDGSDASDRFDVGA